MRHHATLLLIGTLLLGACQIQVVGPVPGKTPGPTKATIRPLATPVAEKTPSPKASPDVTGSAVPSATTTAPPSTVALPAGPLTAVSGSVKIDAHYLIGQAGGNVIATGGGNVISVGGGNVISVGGGNLIGQAGGNVISVGGGNLLGQAGGNLRLLAETATEVPLGTVLPVKGMGVVPISLTTGQPIGPAVFTDEKGEYRLNIPAAYQENFVIHAMVPGKDAQDPLLKDARLRYKLVVSPGKAEAATAIDEDTSVASSYVLQCFKNRIKDIMVANDAEIEVLVQEIADSWNVPVALRAIINLTVIDLNKNAREAGFTKDTPNLDEAAQAVFSAMLAHMDNLYGLMTDSGQIDESDAETLTEKELAMVAMIEAMRVLREATAAKIASGFAFEADILKEANEARRASGKEPYKIERPSDLGDFIIKEYLAAPGELSPFVRTKAVFATMLSEDPALGVKTNARLRAGALTILGEVGKIMTTNEKAKLDVKATLKAYGKPAVTP